VDGEGRPLASRTKGKEFLRMLMRSMTSGAETTENRVAAKTNALIVGQLREMGSVVKDCVDSEVRKYYYLFCAMVAAEKTAERDINGMNRKTTAALNIPRGAGSVYGRQCGARAEFLATAGDKSPLRLGEAVHSRHGVGTLKELGLGRVVVDHGDGAESVFAGLGRGHGEAWARRALPSLLPPEREQRSDNLEKVIIEDIHDFCRRRCPMSPCLKDLVRNRVGIGNYVEDRPRYRLETWNEYWTSFRRMFAVSAANITTAEKPGECPRAFRDNQPWNLRTKGGDTCLCQSCENMEKHGMGRYTACRLLKKVKGRREASVAAAGGGVGEEKEVEEVGDEGDDDEESDGRLARRATTTGVWPPERARATAKKMSAVAARRQGGQRPSWRWQTTVPRRALEARWSVGGGRLRVALLPLQSMMRPVLSAAAVRCLVVAARRWRPSRRSTP